MSEKEYIKDQVTVVIPVYNEEHFLRQALEVDCVIIGDNASSGGRVICREFDEKYPQIKHFRHEKNYRLIVVKFIRKLCQI